MKNSIKIRKMLSIVCSIILIQPLSLATAAYKQANMDRQPRHHAISLYGKPKYPADFQNFEYANPNAPKGGALRQGIIGHFDSINPYIDRGISAAGSQLMYDSLLARSWDEPLTKYGLVAESIELDPDSYWVAFQINPKASFHDGVPVTAEDVKFSFDLLREKGSAFYKQFYLDIERVDVINRYRVLFIFNNNQNHELPMILGQMPVLPKHYWKTRDFSLPGLEIPVTSGPYKPIKIDPGRSITFARVENYWGKDLPVNRGRHNFSNMQYEYYRSMNVMIEALQKGEYDFKLVTNPKVWHDQISNDSLKTNQLVRKELTDHNPHTLTITYNTRKPLLQDIRVRKAIGYGVDFNWINEHQFHSMYSRATSFFAGTELASSGLPTPAEMTLLHPWKNELPPEMFSQIWQPPGGEPGLTNRERKSKALTLLEAAGWRVSNNQQVNNQGKALELEIMLSNQEQERIMTPIKKSLENLGIKLHVRNVDIAQYIERVRSQDFDMVVHTFSNTPSPGTEQASLWGSATVDQHGTRNIAGARLPVIDHLTKVITEAASREELVAIVRAMDRVLLWNHFSLPIWYQPKLLIIHKKQLQHPEQYSRYALDLSTWWYHPNK